MLGVNSYTKLILGTARTKVSRSRPLTTSGEAFSGTIPTKKQKRKLWTIFYVAFVSNPILNEMINEMVCA